jgi:hypothetical protein
VPPYRSCRYEWHELSVKEKQNQFKNRTQCDEFGIYYSTNMLLVAHAIEKHVLAYFHISMPRNIYNHINVAKFNLWNRIQSSSNALYNACFDAVNMHSVMLSGASI